jgi:[ribosomal protein S18]-alanine N-acetyltransferase
MKHELEHISNVLLRHAIAEDVAGIVAIEHLSFDYAGERFSERRIRYLIGSERCIVTVAQVEDWMAGWVAGHTARRNGGPWARVYALAIHPDARGRKLGPKLLGQMIAALRRRVSGPLYLEVRPDNHPAVKLYEKFGFTPCARLPDYYGPGQHAQRMVLIPA